MPSLAEAVEKGAQWSTSVFDLIVIHAHIVPV